MSQKILLVEGAGDRTFFESVLKSFQNSDVEVKIPTITTPTDLGSAKDGKEEIIKQLLSQTTLNRLRNANTSHLGIVVDADYIRFGQGLQKTLQRFNKNLIDINLGYQNAKQISLDHQAGWMFANEEGLKPIGLWVMQDGNEEGMFEDFFLNCLKPDDENMKNYACEVVKGLRQNSVIDQNKLFKKQYESKASVGTWNAWQQIPNMPITVNRLDESAQPVQQLIAWLKEVFELS